MRRHDISLPSGLHSSQDASAIPLLTGLTAPPGSYARLELKAGARLVAEFGMGVRLQRVTEYRTACVEGFSKIGGFCPQQFYSIHVVSIRADFSALRFGFLVWSLMVASLTRETGVGSGAAADGCGAVLQHH